MLVIGIVARLRRARLLLALLVFVVGMAAIAPGSALALNGPCQPVGGVNGSTSWTNPNGGSWDDFNNWSNGTPSPSCSTSITLAGTYTVVMPDGALSAGVTVGGASGTQTLQVVGTTQTNGTFQDSVLSPSYSGQQLTIGAHGVLQMTSSGSNPGRSIVGGDIASSGLITVDPGASGPNTGRDLRANVTNNAGGVIAFHTDVNTCGCGAGGTWINNGGFTVDAGTTAFFSRTGAGAFLTQAGGTFANNGRAIFDGGIAHTGGTTTGNPIQVCGNLDAHDPGTASFEIINDPAYCGGGAITSDIGAGDTVLVNNNDPNPSHQILVSGGSFTNNGTLTLEGDLGEKYLIGGGLITNTGTLNLLGAGRSELQKNLLNTGAVNVGTGETLTMNGTIAQSGGTLTNSGTLDANHAVTLSGGSIANSGTFSGGDFTHTGGGTSGDPIQLCGGTLNPTGPGVASFQIVGSGCNSATIGSDIGPGDTVEVHTAPGSTIDVYAGRLTNHGTFSLDSTATSLVQLHGTGNPNVLTNEGTLNLTGINVSTALVNHGTTNVVAAPGLNTGFSTPITQAAGSLNVPGSLSAPSLSMTGGSTTVDGMLNVTNNLPLTGGTLLGAGTVIDPSGVTNSGGTVHPGHSPGLLSITGDYTQTSGGTLAIDAVGTAAGTGYSQLAVSGNASIAGALHVNTTTPQTGTLTILTANSVTGTFSPITFTGQTDTVAYITTAVQVNATAPPVATGPPMVAGSATVGSTLRSTQGSFSGSPTSFAYQWRDCNASGAGCIDVAGATASTYLVVGSDIGHTLVVVVTATNAGGSASVSSDPTAVIPPVSAPAPAPPVVTGAPVVSGPATVGSTLSSTPGSFSGSPTSFAYQWLHCNAAGAACINIAGATASTYTVAAADVGYTLVVTVTASNAGGSGVAASSPTAVVPQASVSPVISRLHLGSHSFTAAAGTTLVLDLSERATLTITVSHRVSGHITRRHCSTRAKHGRHCSLTVAVRRITLNAIAGHNVLSLRFPGLKPGHYTMAVVAHDSSGRRSHPVTVSFVAKAP